ncbi:MAG: glycosyltransferase [Novosphingobium sp.]|nr:glycosyltransferase [Novosphingobium sp.]
MHVLSISTLFPNPVRPSFGIFVGNQMRAVAARGDVDLTMVSPIGIPLWPLSRRAPYAQLQAVPAISDAIGLDVHYPKFLSIPRIGGDSNPRRIIRSILPSILKLHRDAPFDLVDASFFFPDGPVAAQIAIELGLPLVIKARGADIHYWGSRNRARAQMLEAAGRATVLLAVSEALKTDMAALGMPKDRIEIHYTGLDHTRFKPVDRRQAREAIASDPSLAIPVDGPLFVLPGALIARKGQRFAIEALAQLPDARMALAGSGEDEAMLRRLTAKLDLNDRVHFLGLVTHERLPTLLSAANAMVLPSASEGLANAWVEALACGAPIIIPEIGGAREVVQDQSAGRIVARNADAIANAIRELLANPPEQALVAANAAPFSWENNAARLVEIWRRAIER